MKEKLIQYKVWLNERPKKVYFFLMVLVISSLIGNIVREIFFPEQYSPTKIPMLYTRSDNEKMSLQKNQDELDKIMKEVHTLQKKKDENRLDRKDSIRIEYLYNEYKKLKNGY